MKYMGSDVEVEYKPDTRRVRVYEILYQKYLKIAEIVK
jgi:L-ribulokinase